MSKSLIFLFGIIIMKGGGVSMENVNFFDSLSNYIEINIRRCSHIRKDQQWSENSMKADYDLWIVLDGKMTISIQGVEYIAGKEDMILLYPKTQYKAKSITPSCKFIFIHFDFVIGNNIRALDDLPFWGIIPAQAANREVKSLIESYWDYQQKRPLSFLNFKGHFTVLLSKIIAFKFMDHKLPLQQNQRANVIARLDSVFSYISENMQGDIDISDLATVTGMSEKYFITYFKSVVGITPGNYITQVKMNKALDYLYENKYSIKEIAASLGYSDQYTFSKAFKRMYKVSPSKYSQLELQP